MIATPQEYQRRKQICATCIDRKCAECGVTEVYRQIQECYGYCPLGLWKKSLLKINQNKTCLYPLEGV